MSTFSLDGYLLESMLLNEFASLNSSVFPHFHQGCKGHSTPYCFSRQPIQSLLVIVITPLIISLKVYLVCMESYQVNKVVSMKGCLMATPDYERIHSWWGVFTLVPWYLFLLILFITKYPLHC